MGSFGHSAIQEIFFEDFEAEYALDKWAITSTNEGRVAIAEDPRGTGNSGLLMDDSVNNAIFSQNVAQTTIAINDFTHLRVQMEVFSLNNPVPINGGFARIVLRAGDLSQKHSITWEVEQTFDFWVDPALLEAAGLVTVMSPSNYTNTGTFPHRTTVCFSIVFALPLVRHARFMWLLRWLAISRNPFHLRH